MEAEGPTLSWLQARLSGREASQASQALFAAVKEASQLSIWTTQAVRARTAGRSAGVGRRRALAGSVTTATVLPVMSKGMAYLGYLGVLTRRMLSN